MATLTTKYNLSFEKVTAKFEVTYYKGLFQSIKYKSGGINEDVLKKIGFVFPMKEDGIPAKVKEYNGRLKFKSLASKVKKPFTLFLDRYQQFFSETTGMSHKMNGAEGKALKQIIEYLEKESITDDEPIQVWDFLLSSWDNVEPFFKKQNLIRQINMNLTTLLTQIKDGRKNTSNSQAITSASLAKSFFDRYGKK